MMENYHPYSQDRFHSCASFEKDRSRSRSRSSYNYKDQDRDKDKDRDDEKGEVIETSQIRGLTLLFENKSLEKKWNKYNETRTKGLAMRYMFFCFVFQAIFYWSDNLELRHGILNSNDLYTFFILFINLSITFFFISLVLPYL